MPFVCPTCRRSFDAAGPCPFDRTTLVDGAIIDSPTQPETLRVLSATDSSTDALATLRRARGSSLYDAMLGHTLDGRYYIDRKIGEGGMGVVFAARHAVIERPLAIKVLKREVTRDPATIQRFVQEAKAASRIGHPNIIDVTDFGTTPDGMTYAVMELIVGKTLKQTLRDEAPLPALRAIKIAAQLARALGAAHDKGIVHRDLKPENVFLVEREGRTDFVKIVDFGIAKVAPIGDATAPRLTRAGSVFGTPEYMAPEQASGKGDTDHRVDVYALGVILYEMVTGKVPLKGESAVQTLAMQMLDAPPPPSQKRPDLEIRPELEAVIMKALAKNRDERFADMAALLAALEKTHAVIGQSITGTPIYALVPPPTRAKTPTARVKGEPEFVATTERPTFDAVYDDPLPVVTRRASWPIVVFPVLALAGIGAAIAVYALRHKDPEPPPKAPIVAVVPVDAARAIEPPADAAAVIEPPIDAVEPALIDAAPALVDAGIRVRSPRDAAVTTGPVTTPNGRGTIGIQVVTKPDGAQLYAGTSYRGPSGVTLEEPYGTKLELHCRQKGYKEGTVELAFDGKTEIAICVMTRIKICIDGVKNPFDDCEVDPTKTP